MIDNGVGFGVFKNNIKDILHPYFTTKKNGTGLGLSIVNKIVNDHNGKIDFIKIDVQGYEYKVLKGAKKTLTNNNPIICLEEDKPQDSETIPYLKSLNYSIIDIINKEHIFKKKS